MFATLKQLFEKRQGLKKDPTHPVLTLRGVGTQAIRAEVPVFRGTRSFSEEVINRVAKEIELEGLGAPGSVIKKEP